jgi:uncharacterized membrane protein
MNDEEELRDRAKRRIEAKRGFYSHLGAYVGVNLMLVGIWATTGAGYFWPIWPMLGWGVAIVIQAWGTFARPSVTESAIQKEMERLRHQ